MKRIQTRSMTLALAVVTLAAGCTFSGTNSYTGVLGDTELIQERRNTSLARRLTILTPRSRWDGDRLLVEFDLCNKRGAPLEIEYRVEWFDRDGFVVDTRHHWHPLVLAERSEVPLSLTAPTPDAVTWKLDVRESEPVR